MNSNTIFMLLFILAFFDRRGSCNSLHRSVPVQTKTISNSGDSIFRDSLAMLVRKEIQLVEISLSKDTLTVVSGDRNLYYPFGRSQKIGSFIKDKRYTISFEVAEDETRLYRLRFGKSFIKIFKDTDSELFELVSGKIIDQGIVLTNGVSVGITRDELLKKVFQKIIPLMRDIRVIVLSSAADGVWHYYTFENERLIQISFDTDVVYNKK